MRYTVLLPVLLLAACAGQPPRAPVEDRNAPRASASPMVEPHPAVPEPKRPPPPVAELPPRAYTVVGGDTLYSIAWRYGFDYRALARANGIARPYTIYPGQTLKLSAKAPPEPVTVAKKTTEPSPPPAPEKSKPSKPAPAPKNTTSPARVKKPSSKAVITEPPSPKPEEVFASGPIRWRWPTEGKVVRGFSGTTHKGIDIDGRAGDGIMAVADGRVVYAGNGIVGYGNLLIVKHNDIYLSAYGHNRKLLVSEGDVVKAGQKIAEKGSSATNSVKLHFEIRREGKPVDPKRLLPRR